MKALLCLGCTDIRALPPAGSVTCRCGNSVGRWYDSKRGYALVDGKDRSLVRVVGIHNGWLRGAVDPSVVGNTGWRDLTDYLVSNAHGYLFHSSMRGALVVIIRVGESDDTTWMDNGVYFKTRYGIDDSNAEPVKSAADLMLEAREALREWSEKQGHEKCHYYPDIFRRLADILGVLLHERDALPPREEFLPMCRRYEGELYGSEG